MMSLRNASRAALRQTSRLSAKQPAASAAARRHLTTSNAIYKPSSALKQTTSRIISALPRRAAFSTTQLVRQEQQDGQVDGELALKLQEEYNLEEEMGLVDELPSHLQDFLDGSGFALSETPGTEEVVLTKQFGSETVKVSFSIADLDAYDPEADAFAEDNALADEDVPSPERAQKGSEEAALEGEDGEEAEASFPARIDVSIEKPGAAGAMQFTGTLNDGQIVIENVFYFPTKEMADAKNAEADWQRRGLYTGPPYGNLDPDLQVLLERYLDERGINTALAIWVPEYIDFKEQREYLSWLQSLKNFVEA